MPCKLRKTVVEKWCGLCLGRHKQRPQMLTSHKPRLSSLSASLDNINMLNGNAGIPTCNTRLVYTGTHIFSITEAWKTPTLCVHACVCTWVSTVYVHQFCTCTLPVCVPQYMHSVCACQSEMWYYMHSCVHCSHRYSCTIIVHTLTSKATPCMHTRVHIWHNKEYRIIQFSQSCLIKVVPDFLTLSCILPWTRNDNTSDGDYTQYPYWVCAPYNTNYCRASQSTTMITRNMKESKFPSF